jgi:hypothetical protein
MNLKGSGADTQETRHYYVYWIIFTYTNSVTLDNYKIKEIKIFNRGLE